MRGPRLQLALPRYLQERQPPLVRDGGLWQPLEGPRLLRAPQGGNPEALAAAVTLSLCPGESECHLSCYINYLLGVPPHDYPTRLGLPHADAAGSRDVQVVSALGGVPLIGCLSRSEISRAAPTA